jgi:hypothetical protein
MYFDPCSRLCMAKPNEDILNLRLQRSLLSRRVGNSASLISVSRRLSQNTSRYAPTVATRCATEK